MWPSGSQSELQTEGDLENFKDQLDKLNMLGKKKEKENFKEGASKWRGWGGWRGKARTQALHALL